MNVAEYTMSNLTLASRVEVDQPGTSFQVATTHSYASFNKRFDPLQPVRQWLDSIKVQDRHLAHQLCQMIPAQCPFERDVKLFGRTLFHIPPLCKLNPVYDEVVGLRFRALCYLADECGEDITAYC